MPVHPPSAEKHGKDYARPGNLVSNGAFMLTENVPNSQIKLDKNPHYHDAANVKLDQVIYYPTSDSAAAMRRFKAGELHSNADIPAGQMDSLRSRFGDQIRIAPVLGSFYLQVNNSKAPFNDLRVRSALSLLIDRDFLAETIWGKTMVPAYSIVPPGISPNYKAPPAPAYAQMSLIEREDRAKALLKEVGFGPGKPLKIEIRYNMSDNNKATVIAIAEMWKPHGIEVSFINTDQKTHVAHLRSGGDFDVARSGWFADYPDPQNFLFLFQSKNANFNYSKYNSKAYDDALAKAGAELDPAKRMGFLRDAEAQFVADVPVIPLMFFASKNIVSPKLEGWHTNPLDMHLSRYISIKQ